MALSPTYRARLSGFATGAVAMAAVAWALGWFAAPDRVALVMDRFVALCKPGSREPVIHSSAYDGLIPYPGTIAGGSMAEELWDPKAEVRLSVDIDRCSVIADIVPFDPAQEAALATAFLEMAADMMPGAIHEDIAAQNNAALFHVFKDRVPDPQEFLMLARWGHQAPPHDGLRLNYGFKLETPSDA
ncbi:hypothetical protein AIOL_000334 [Candidatus Rhodobacter oscarellae]|uniref:Transmembrane protein n=1 Tax=Candidatus Rhodobacter oscarellae TaxID=1675527 RepID=A0A0J9EC30_9RHOB|nr:hypothetical protein [Candidatus Rhodobacter lobularis]KMW60181.1 hypothetical protein AIOL_000334 [Candidatus Rhodobacter lobularis]